MHTAGTTAQCCNAGRFNAHPGSNFQDRRSASRCFENAVDATEYWRFRGGTAKPATENHSENHSP
jgi:hypothetical protein